MFDKQPPNFILLLGSYDPDTKSLLYDIREYIANKFQDEIYGLVLEEVDIYLCDNDYVLLVEKGSAPAFYLFYLYKLVDVFYPDRIDRESIENFEIVVRETLREKHGIDIKKKLTILDKLRELARDAKLILIIRDKQSTRCGEYIELAFLLMEGADPSKIIFLWNKDIEISSMVKELLDRFNFNIRIYSSKEDLFEEIYRLIYNKVLDQTT